MNYELAKQLKDAGFPQEGEGIDHDLKSSAGNYDKNVYEENVYYPTLSELIDACDKQVEHFILHKDGSEWAALSDDAPLHNTLPMSADYEGGDKTPLIAVAKLWLKLHDK